MFGYKDMKNFHSKIEIEFPDFISTPDCFCIPGFLLIFRMRNISTSKKHMCSSADTIRQRTGTCNIVKTDLLT